MATDKLSDVALRSIKPRDKQFKLSDGGGLFLLVNPNGSRLWRLAYRFGGRQKALALGSYPATSLSDAREARRKAKGLLEAGTDPGEDRKERKVAVKAAREAAENTFAAVAEKYLTKAEKEGRAAITMGKARWLLNDLAAGLADKLVHEIAPKDVLAVLRPIEAKGNYETARRLRSTIGRVLRFAVANGWAERDATADLKGALIAPNVRHRAAIVKPEPLGSADARHLFMGRRSADHSRGAEADGPSCPSARRSPGGALGRDRFREANVDRSVRPHENAACACHASA
ncbi:MAG: integrase arm-type DNA-binding domain-containing protein [Aquamicrobium sp.]|nr:integrase arm-type DNA-binding domain-containing protein [Aquamicrobium sp.]